MINEKIIQRMANKASQSHCLYRVAAMAISKNGELLGFSVNKPRFPRVSGSIHAEMALMSRYGKRIKTIIICRINRTGKLVKINACKTCQEKADELGIKIEGIKE
jgi:hypothetical protein